ncbi:MAG: hypothetical protein AAFX09_00415 [Pseudomonadota bacterium]
MTRPSYDFASATFFFFKAFARRPMGVLWIGLIQIALYTALTVWSFAMFGPLFELLIEAAGQSREPDDAEVLAVMGGAFVQIPLLIFLSLAVVVMIQGAWLRLLTRDEIAAGIPLRFGFDELRLVGVNLCFIVLGWLGYLAAFIIVLAVGAAGVGATAATDGSIWTALGGGLVAFVFVIAGMVLAIYFALRFAAAPALSIAQKRFRLFGAFAASRDVFGWMLVSYIVLLLVWIVGVIAVSVVQQVVALAMIGGAMGELMALGQMSDADPAQVAEALSAIITSPGLIAGLIVSVIIWMAFQIVFEGLWHGVGAYVAVRHTGGDAAEPEDISAPAESVGESPSEG